MRKKDQNILIGIGIAIILVIFSIALFSAMSQNEEDTNTSERTNENISRENDSNERENDNEQEGLPAVTFSLGDISERSSRDNCWMVINGDVYDVTDYISSHPGGGAIVEGCGKDATDLFEERQMGSGTPHSSRARNVLERYYVGKLEM